ncbi:hypothetical protein [Pantoea stewartii]|nr:hypothetical protein [Pantoea stewartii]
MERRIERIGNCTAQADELTRRWWAAIWCVAPALRQVDPVKMGSTGW